MIDRSRLQLSLMIVVLLFGVFAVACGGGDDDDSANDTPSGNGETEVVDSSEAQMIFTDVGCAECHGEQGEGVGDAPGTVLAGTRNIIQQFRTRVRNGRGSAMPAYTEEQISDEQIELLLQWLQDM